jgi:hypothetical protein
MRIFRIPFASSLRELMAKYTIVQGKFPCHACKEEVHSLRHYIEDQLLTWMCSSKHLSEVSLNTRKTKEERRERAERNQKAGS